MTEYGSREYLQARVSNTKGTKALVLVSLADCDEDDPLIEFTSQTDVFIE